MDEAEFYISTNLGEDPRPLARVARMADAMPALVATAPHPARPRSHGARSGTTTQPRPRAGASRRQAERPRGSRVRPGPAEGRASLHPPDFLIAAEGAFVVDGEEFLIMREEEVLGVVEGK